MAKYKLKQDVIAKGYENILTIPYSGKALQKTFTKDTILEGVKKTISNQTNTYSQTVILVDEENAIGAIDLDTKQPYTGKAQWAIDPQQVEQILSAGTSHPTGLKSSDTDKFIIMMDEILTKRNIIIGIAFLIVLILIFRK